MAPASPSRPPPHPRLLHLCSWAPLSGLPSLNSLFWAPRPCFSTTIAALAQEKVPRKASGDNSREQCVPPYIRVSTTEQMPHGAMGHIRAHQ